MSPADSICRWANSSMARGDIKETAVVICTRRPREAKHMQMWGNCLCGFSLYALLVELELMRQSGWTREAAVDAGGLYGEQADRQSEGQTGSSAGLWRAADRRFLETRKWLILSKRVGKEFRDSRDLLWPNEAGLTVLSAICPLKTIRAVEAPYAGLGHADDYLPKHSKHVESEFPWSPIVNIKHVWYLQYYVKLLLMEILQRPTKRTDRELSAIGCCVLLQSTPFTASFFFFFKPGFNPYRFTPSLFFSAKHNASQESQMMTFFYWSRVWSYEYLRDLVSVESPLWNITIKMAGFAVWMNRLMCKFVAVYWCKSWWKRSLCVRSPTKSERLLCGQHKGSAVNQRRAEAVARGCRTRLSSWLAAGEIGRRQVYSWLNRWAIRDAHSDGRADRSTFLWFIYSGVFFWIYVALISC